MIIGYVKYNRAMLPVTVQTVLGNLVAHFVIDTGFEGFLTLRPEQIAALGLPYVGETNLTLADESGTRSNVHQAVILWHGEEIEANIIALDSRPLLGSQLLRGCQVCIDFEEGRLVTVEQNATS